MMTEKEYVEGGGQECLVCGSGNIEGGPIEKEEYYYTQEMTCTNCQASWNDVLELKGISEFSPGNYVVSVILGGKRLTQVVLPISTDTELHVIQLDITGLPDSDKLYCEDHKGFRYKRQIKNPGSMVAQFYKI